MLALCSSWQSLVASSPASPAPPATLRPGESPPVQRVRLHRGPARPKPARDRNSSRSLRRGRALAGRDATGRRLRSGAARAAWSTLSRRPRRSPGDGRFLLVGILAGSGGLSQPARTRRPFATDRECPRFRLGRRRGAGGAHGRWRHPPRGTGAPRPRGRPSGPRAPAGRVCRPRGPGRRLTGDRGGMEPARGRGWHRRSRRRRWALQGHRSGRARPSCSVPSPIAAICGLLGMPLLAVIRVVGRGACGRCAMDGQALARLGRSDARPAARAQADGRRDGES